MLTVNRASLAAVNARLKEMSEKAGKQTVRQAARKAMTPVKDQIIATAPIDRSEDADNVRIVDNVAMTSKWNDDTLTVRIGIKGGAKENPDTPWYWRQVEFGNKNMPARPFMAPALEANTQQIIDAVTAELRKAIFE